MRLFIPPRTRSAIELINFAQNRRPSRMHIPRFSELMAYDMQLSSGLTAFTNANGHLLKTGVTSSGHLAMVTFLQNSNYNASSFLK